MNTPQTLLVIGIHREELAFGQTVARDVDPAQVAVLEIPEGLSGQPPRGASSTRPCTGRCTCNCCPMC
ncbi:hypothetical protein [Azotobacter beijerinckii]|uniref:Uncharacterized protein n=1 Tax=Azotobacter beijerinckii TaxID=170623 RepID=A0A1I4HYL0_9GAMM|nr:hypothetical protein [Azotobacter beijerinckii]SFB63287.1 hypothetical protein SAMN04244571_04522 [Azotobacter beijerinckii]SFL47199.1 hypothetical protein SAMN04244574_04411 [Azotobacter beijerinckii]